MFAYARLRLPSAESAEEAVQAALAAAWRSRDSFERRSSERTWLMGILRHKVLDLLAQRRRSRSRHGAPDSTGDSGGDLFVRGGFAQPQRPWGRAPDDAELREAIREALAELPDAMRSALVLREVDGLSGREVCEVLGVSETNLWTLVHRGKARVRASLAHRFGNDWEHGP